MNLSCIDILRNDDKIFREYTLRIIAKLDFLHIAYCLKNCKKTKMFDFICRGGWTIAVKSEKE